MLKDKFIKYLNQFDDEIKSKSLLKNRKGFDRIIVEIDEINILELMRMFEGNVKIYFSPSDNSFSTFAMLSLKEYKTDNYDDNFKNILKKDISLFLNNDIKIFGGISFSRKKKVEKKEILKNSWKEFPEARFILPKFEIIKRNNKYFIAYNFVINDDLINNYYVNINQLISSFNWNIINDNNPVNIYKHSFFPNYDKWFENINEAILLFNRKKYIKIALARKTEFYSKNKINSLIIFEKLISNSINSYNFYFEFNNSVFLGNSPEKLFKIENNIISSDSLAGTRKRDISVIKNIYLENELLKSKKDIDEFNIVKEDIITILNELCSGIISDSEMKVKKLNKVQHLFSEIKGELKENYSAFNIIDKIHPTPAVGTRPRDNENIIYQLEQFDRGWYAGPIGYFSRNKSEFAVGIRTCLINDNKMNLFTGAGITNNSQADAEWEEINNKMSDYLDIINYDIN
jgi:menaquinone-specific isochorismate synthase